MEPPLLFQRFPGLGRTVPWLSLAQLPTPVETIRLGARTVLVKRDDLTGPRYGGNKVRKLEFLLADARARGARRVVTAGAYGSHHALATALYARRLGLAATSVLFPQRPTAHVREVLAAITSESDEVRFTRRMEGVPFALRRARWAHPREAVCIIPPGGSSALGTLGYVNAALELDAQIEAGACAAPSVVHVAGGTLGTAAGLALGFALAGRAVRVEATRITSTLVTNPRTLRSLVRGALALLAPGIPELPSEAAVLAGVRLRDDQVGGGYGHETPAGAAALAAFADAGLQLDATYTAKCAAALLADADALPLFWLTLSSTHPEVDSARLHGSVLPEPVARVLREG